MIILPLDATIFILKTLEGKKSETSELVIQRGTCRQCSKLWATIKIIVVIIPIDVLIQILQLGQGQNKILMIEFLQDQEGQPSKETTSQPVKFYKEYANHNRQEDQLENKSDILEQCNYNILTQEKQVQQYQIEDQNVKDHIEVCPISSDDNSPKNNRGEISNSEQSTNHQTFNHFDQEQVSQQKISQILPQNIQEELVVTSAEINQTFQNQDEAQIIQKQEDQESQINDFQQDDLKKSDAIQNENEQDQNDDSNKVIVENQETEEIPPAQKKEEINQDHQDVKIEIPEQADEVAQRQEIKEDHKEAQFAVDEKSEGEGQQIQDVVVQQDTQSEVQLDKEIKQVENNPLNESLIIMEQIFQKSYKNRAVPYELRDFVGAPQDFGKLVNNYFGGQKSNYKEAIKQMSKELKGFRRIRGDGNCFYTAFTYQYFRLLLEQPQRKEEFLQQINDLVITITYQDIKIEDNKFIVQEFIRQFCELQNEEDLFERIKNPEEIFYGLSIMVMRNYIIQIYNNQKELVEMGGQEYIIKNIQTWEEECNSNEIIISALATHLKLNVIVHFIDKKNQSYDRKQYGEQEQPKIALLLSPGHYQIGLL